MESIFNKDTFHSSNTHQKKINYEQFILIIIILLNIGFYLPCLRCYFAADDWYQIEKRNPEQVISTFYGDWHIGERDKGGFYRPLIRVTFYIEQLAFGLNAVGYHITNLTFHLFCVAILFLILRKISKSFFITWFCTLIFSVFPTHTEPIFWISGRTDIIASCFLLASLYFWISFLFYNKEQNDFYTSNIFTSKNFFLIFTYIFFVMSLLSKEISLIFIFITPVFILQKYILTKSFSKSEILHFLFFIVIGIIYFICRTKILGSVGGYSQRGDIISLYSFRQTYKTFLFSLINPITGTIPFIRPIIAFAILFFLYLLSIILLRFPFMLLLGGYWLFISILPMLSLTVSPLSGGRFLYLPSIGYCIIISSLLDYLFFETNKQTSASYAIKRFKNLGFFFIGLIFAGYLMIGKARHTDWVLSGDYARKVLDELKTIIRNEYTKDSFSKSEDKHPIIIINERPAVGSAHLFQGWSIMQAIHVYMNNKDIPIQVELREFNNENAVYLYLARDASVMKYDLKEKQIFEWDFKNINELNIGKSIISIKDDITSFKIDSPEYDGIITPNIDFKERGRGLFYLNMSVKNGGGYKGEIWEIDENNLSTKLLGNIYNDIYENFHEHNINLGWIEGNFKIRILPSNPPTDFVIKKIKLINFLFKPVH